MGTLQKDFIDTLVNLAPQGYTARIKTEYANTGAIYYQDADFTTLLGVAYNFQDGYASFNLTTVTSAECEAIGARHTGACKPAADEFTWDGWGYVQYAKGELKQVRDGIAALLTARAETTNQVNHPDEVTLSRSVLLRAAYGLLGDGAGREWGSPDTNEYTRGIAELVANLIPGTDDIGDRREQALHAIRQAGGR